jgi:hypothetical protein
LKENLKIFDDIELYANYEKSTKRISNKVEMCFIFEVKVVYYITWLGVQHRFSPLQNYEI